MLPGAPWGSGRGWRGHVLVVADDDAQPVVQPRDRDLAIGESGGDSSGLWARRPSRTSRVSLSRMRTFATVRTKRSNSCRALVFSCPWPMRRASRRYSVEASQLQVDVSPRPGASRWKKSMDSCSSRSPCAGVAVERRAAGSVSGWLVNRVGLRGRGRRFWPGAPGQPLDKDAGVAIAAPDVVQLDAASPRRGCRAGP